MHTLKGNAGACGLETIAQQAHELEDAVSEGADDAPPRERLRAAWAGIHARLAAWSGPGDLVGVERAELAALANEARRRVPELATALERLAWDRVDARLVEIGNQAARLAERLGKPRPHVEVRAARTRTPPGLHQAFFGGLVHVLRNAVDHGLEDAETRVAAGKHAAGVLSLGAVVEDDTLHVEIADDGRGIDWTTPLEPTRTDSRAQGTRTSSPRSSPTE